MLRDNVRPYTQKLFEVLEQTGLIKKRWARLEVDSQIQIAVWTGLASGYGTEDCVRYTLRLRATHRISGRRWRSPSSVRASAITLQAYRHAASSQWISAASLAGAQLKQ